jgi:Poly(ADP-ribose) polymerase catalytic domain
MTPEELIVRAGRKVLRVDKTTDGGSRFERAKKALSERCDCNVRVRTMYHTTSVAAGRAIMAEGFRVPKRGGCFGRGVNLSPDVEHTLMYNSGEACTLVCKVAIGKAHANTSRQVPGQRDTVPDHMRPKRGYDAMYGAGGMIVVVPSAARVRPVRMIVHVTAGSTSAR